MSGKATPGATSPLGRYGISRLLAGNMRTMERLGPEVLRPFLQDVVQAGGLVRTLGGMVAEDPVFALRLAPYLGVGEILLFARHFVALCFFAGAARAAEAAGLYEYDDDGDAGSAGKLVRSFRVQRKLEQLRWGSGRDYTV